MNYGRCPLCRRRVQVTKRGRLRRHRYKRGDRAKALFRGRALCMYSGANLLIGWEAAAACSRDLLGAAHVIAQLVLAAPRTPVRRGEPLFFPDGPR